MGEPISGVGWRGRAVEALAGRRFDLLVIGGGILGAAVAAHAARLGLAVALVEAGDFASGTSGASSKLIHGGLRYLRLGDVRLVREAHRERRLLMRVVAPHLVRRLPFLLPLYEGGPYRPWLVQSGILLYSALARSRLSWLVAPERARALAPGLRLERLRSCALYADAWTNDARLTLANVRAAAEAGAVVLNGAEVVSLRASSGRLEGAEVRVDDEVVPVRARAVVNAAGPWIDRVRRLESPRAGTSVRLSKGVHALVPARGEWQAALTLLQDSVRVTFAVPWYGMLLLGTTDEPYEGDPSAVQAEPSEVEQVLAEASLALDPELVRPERVRAVLAGLRVLPAGKGESVSARRETVYTVGPLGMVSVAGGKLTTYRAIALGALARLRAPLGLHRLETRPWPLPGAQGLADTRLPVELAPAVRAHLLHLYGSLAPEVLAPALEEEALLEPLHPDGPDLAVQALYAVTHEWARRPEDVARRRTTLYARGLATEETMERVARIAAGAVSAARGSAPSPTRASRRRR